MFFYFGLQKPAPVFTPVRVPLAEYFGTLGIPLGAAILFIGLYEMTMGVLFMLKRIRVLFWMFFAHQAIAFSTLIVIPKVAFQPPWLTIPVLGADLPWALAGFSAFVLKNVIFVGGFLVLASVELGDADEIATSTD
ncbi:hypothetical protein [Haloarchaeobius sp. DYHT-AS-18]|uniref:hypothetical protein n=1 Tax=Haloarchaeobius sp. DYHT-AS-18 TaxID=3446117 RepID=UPI003EC09D19